MRRFTRNPVCGTNLFLSRTTNEHHHPRATWLGAADGPYTTFIVNGALDVGDAGIRIVGVLWLVAAAAFAVAAVALWQERHTAVRIVLAATGFSLLICIIGLPAGIIGVGVDVAILLALATLAVARPAVWRTAIR